MCSPHSLKMNPLFVQFNPLYIMKTIEINLYKFDELSEEAQARAIRKYQGRDFYDWWSFIQYNAKECGVIIESFDTYRGDISASFKWEAHDVANALIYFWGSDTDIGEISKKFLADREALYIDYNDDECEDFDDKEDELVDEFHSDVSHYFLKQLRDELEWLESDECAKDYFISMDVDFTEDGTEY